MVATAIVFIITTAPEIFTTDKMVSIQTMYEEVKTGQVSNRQDPVPVVAERHHNYRLTETVLVPAAAEQRRNSLPTEIVPELVVAAPHHNYQLMAQVAQPDLLRNHQTREVLHVHQHNLPITILQPTATETFTSVIIQATGNSEITAAGNKRTNRTRNSLTDKI